MSPEDSFDPHVKRGVDTPKRVRKRIPTSQKTALAILVIAVLWMASGIFTQDDVDTGTAPAPTPAVATGEEPAAQSAAPHIRVRVSTVTGQEHVREIAILGRVEADKAVSVRAEVPGRVAGVVAQKGALVKVGDVLLKLDPENLPALLAEARARLKQREIAHESAIKLSKGGYSSQLSVAEAKANLEAARAQVTGMQRDLDNATLTAPIAGIVDELPLDVGDFIDKEGEIVARVIDLTTVVAIGEVTERDISSVQLGGAAQVRLPDERVLNGYVSFISKASSALTRTFSVEVTIAVPDMSVPEGLTAELTLPMERVRAHHLSPALLTLDDSGAIGVKTVNTEGVVEFYPVKVVSDNEDGIWLAGLPQEARVITVGQEFVVAGQKVVAVEGALGNSMSVNAQNDPVAPAALGEGN